MLKIYIKNIINGSKKFINRVVTNRAYSIYLPKITRTPIGKILFYSIGVIIGIMLGTFLTFHFLFLYRVLPHGGL